MTLPFAKARAWRESLNLTQGQLGEAIGYSREAVNWFEQGQTPPRRKANGDRRIAPWVWKRYEMACAGLAAQLAAGHNFNWE